MVGIGECMSMGSVYQHGEYISMASKPRRGISQCVYEHGEQVMASMAPSGFDGAVDYQHASSSTIGAWLDGASGTAAARRRRPK